MKNENVETQIIKSLNSDEKKLPPSLYLQNIMARQPGKSGKRKKFRPAFRRLYWGIAAGAAVFSLLMGIVFFAESGKSAGPEFEPAEVRMNLVLPEENIKIIWIQKKNFLLRRTDSE